MIGMYFDQIRDSFKETMTLYNNMCQLEKMFKSGHSSSLNQAHPESMDLQEFILNRGHTFRMNCHELATYLYFLEQQKRETFGCHYFNIRDSMLMSLWNQINDQNDMEAFKAFLMVCEEFSNTTFEVKKELRGATNSLNQGEQELNKELYLS